MGQKPEIAIPSALVGMESYVRDPARFMLDKEGRFWVKNLK
ncbi:MULTISPECIES: hypothetical protein [Bartonella]|nr:hypothetical protein [Bartonella choladocola]